MFRTVWKFVVRPECVDEFVRHYAADGTWAALFREDPHYVATELYRDVDTFVTIDIWTDADAYRRFREEHREAYEALDRATEGLMLREEHVAEG